METTAHYDASTQEFIINSPTPLSQKYWITNGACHANYAIVFAQTYTKGKYEGINCFVVPLRDENGKVLKGVEIQDMGIKMALNGIDNGKLKFNQVRIPRINLLNRYCDVLEDGKIF